MFINFLNINPINWKSLLPFFVLIYRFICEFSTNSICIFIVFIGLRANMEFAPTRLQFVLYFRADRVVRPYNYIYAYAVFSSNLNLSAIIAINSEFVGFPFAADTVFSVLLGFIYFLNTQ